MTVKTKTKIVATIGPASASYEVLKEMIVAGVNVCRINCSHGKHEDHASVIETVRRINEELGVNTALLADLQGPKLRTGLIENNEVMLEEGKELRITTKQVTGTAEIIGINYEKFPTDVKPGEIVLLDDGKLSLKIMSTNHVDEVITTVVGGGILSSRKGVNLPNTKVSLPCLTEKDLIDLDFVLSHNLEWVGLSFVRSASDIIELRYLIAKAGKQTRIVAKIEKPEALEDLDNIIAEADAVMVARGDLGVELPMEQVPVIQKSIVKKCMLAGKPCIIATQMMESMILNMSPTRAEVNDAANSIMDGADAVMLSGETSTGKYPVKVIQNIHKIIRFVESQDNLYRFTLDFEESSQANKERLISNFICRNACRISDETEAAAIVAMTGSGYSAMKIAGYRPRANVYAFTGNRFVLNALSLVWGVIPIYYDKFVSTDHTIADIRYILKKMGYVKDGDLIVNVASIPMEMKGMSNMLKMSIV
jgi:pyruvate kinase